MDNKQKQQMPKLGLVGKDISYSFSRAHFSAKFENEELPYKYENFDISSISEFPNIIKKNKGLVGLNVTIPYKEQVIPFLDDISKKAKKIGAVNTISISPTGRLKGHNTDYYGFKKSIKPLLKSHHQSALILGTGGASKAIAYTLKKLKIRFDYVSRKPNSKAKFLYSDLTDSIISSYSIIINCTPIGTYPNVNECPDIPYDGLTDKHILFDLVYNPIHSKFLVCGELKGATTSNGLSMLEFQAEKAWDIWQLT